eukprot:3698197-Karenia_brevis.AAC.1
MKACAEKQLSKNQDHAGSSRLLVRRRLLGRTSSSVLLFRILGPLFVQGLSAIMLVWLCLRLALASLASRAS